MDPQQPADPNRRWCFCCGKTLSMRQVARHLRDMLSQIEAELPANEVNDPDLDNNGNNAGNGPYDQGAVDPQFALNNGADDDGDIYDDEPMEYAQEDIQPPVPELFVPELPVLEPERPLSPIPLVVQQNPLAEPNNPGFNDPALDDPILADPVLDEPGVVDEDPDGPGEDPPFVEELEPGQPELDPAREHFMTDDEVRALLGAQLGDLADEELLEIYRRVLTERDKRTFLFLSTRLRTHFSRQTYDDLRFGVCESLNLPSEFIAWRRLRLLSGLDSRPYHCCVNSCICYLGKYQNHRSCPYCKEPRYNAANKARRYFSYTPLIPQLQALYRSTEMVEKLQYRVKCDVEAEEDRAAGKPDVIQDVFDGEIYNTLRKTPLDGIELGSKTLFVSA